MKEDNPVNDDNKRANPVLWLVIGLPTAAVVASFATLIVSTRASDQPLPQRYHWEGAAYDNDQARVAMARRVGVTAQLQFIAAQGECRVVLTGAAPDTLRVELAHPTERSQDRHLLMKRDATGYRATCEPLPMAHWWVEMADDSAGWLLRGRLRGSMDAAQQLTSDTMDTAKP